MDRIPIYTAADWKYLTQLRVMLESLNDNITDGGNVQRVVVLTDTTSVENYRTLDASWPRLSVEFRAVDPLRLSGLPVYGHVGLMTYVRLLMEDPDVCPENRILYLDADILIRHPISVMLQAVDGLENPIAAIREVGTYSVSGEGGVFNWYELGLPADRIYFNAGVLGIRMDLVREKKIFSHALNYLIENGMQVISWDQGALNAVCGEVTVWPLEWNFTTSALKPSYRWWKAARLRNIVIAHFTGSGANKPWHINSISPFADEYRIIFFRCGGVLSSNTRLERWLGFKIAGMIRRVRALFY